METNVLYLPPSSECCVDEEKQSIKGTFSGWLVNNSVVGGG